MAAAPTMRLNLIRQFRADAAVVAPFRGLVVLRDSVHNLLDRLARIFRSQQPDTTLNSGVLEHIVLGAPSKLRSLAETMASNPSFLDAADLFSRVGRSARVLLKFITDQGQAKASRFQSWLRYAGTRIENVASGTTVGDRVVAVMLGYSTATLLLAGYLVSGVDRTRSHVVGQALLRVLRQLCIIVKVGSFIFVELMIFPAVCGVLLDLTTLSAVPDATLASVKERFRSNPFTMTLLTWLAGTCFMFVFAMLVSACRENLRQGVCWWIRDPGDPRYHPIRDIIARPTVSQIKKITASASMCESFGMSESAVGGRSLTRSGSFQMARSLSLALEQSSEHYRPSAACCRSGCISIDLGRGRESIWFCSRT